jgi:hypothetical protein
MPAGSWIYDLANRTGGGEPGPPFVPVDAPPVTITSSQVEEVYNGIFEVRITWTKNASANTSNFTGVSIFLEDPDLSETAPAPMDDTVTMDGGTQMAGEWRATHLGETPDSPAVLRVGGHTADRKVRVYLQAFNRIVSSQITRANLPNPTPNAQVTIPAARSSYQSGIEYTWLVTHPTVDIVEDFENVNGAKYQLKYGFDPPDDTIPRPPGLLPFAGVLIVFEYPDDNNRQDSKQTLTVNHPDTWISEPYPAQTATFNVYFCSVDTDGNHNLPIKGVTPMVVVSIVYPPAGESIAPPVTGFTLTNPRHEWAPDGTQWARVTANWINPDATRYSRAQFWRIAPVPVLLLDESSVSPHTLSVIDWPIVAEAWTVAAISVDRSGKKADDPNNLSALSPTAIWNIGPPGTGGQGHEQTPQVTISNPTVDIVQQLNSDGVVMMSQTIKGWANSTDNSFGGVSIARVVKDQDPANAATNVQWFDVPKNATTFTTDWEPAPAAVSWDFYFVARDQQGKRNSIVMGYPGAGTTPKYTKDFAPIPGNVLASRLPRDWFNEAEFEWPAGAAGKFTVEQIVSPKIFVGSILRVGGGTTANVTDPSFAGQSNGQIAVYSNANELRAWMGQQTQGTPDNPGPHPIYGGWFKELYVGGDNPTNAPLYATQAGVVIVGGFDVAGSRYPYISVRNKFGVEVGRMGARVGQGQAGNESTIEGAWFREFAYGGQSFADWRMLARTDPSNPQGSTVEMRNISKFQIDYIQNYPSATNPANAAMTLLFGYDAFVADAANPSYYKFPGISMVRSGTGHQAVFINRGIVLNMPSGSVTNPVKAGAFVTYNGDQFGSDTGTFWCELSMYSPTSQKGNVSLGSGNVGTGASHFRLYDGSATPVLNFGVDEFGNVTIRGSLTLNSSIAATQYFITPTTQVITTGGQFNGPGGVNTIGDVRASGLVSGSALWAGGALAVNSGQQFVGPGGVSTAGGVTAAGAVIGGSLWVGATQAIDPTGQFIAGAGINTAGNIRGALIAGTGFAISGGPSGTDGTFVAGGKTVTVQRGIITSIV